MSIRTARTGDAPALARLATELGYPAITAEIERRLPALLGDDEQLLLVSVDSHDQPVGFLQATVHRSLQHDAQAEIVALVVDVRCRSSGHGRALVERAEAWARERGVTEIRVRSNVTRERTHGFYLDLGYAQTKTSHLFERKLAR